MASSSARPTRTRALAIAERRARILRVALERFVAHGYDATTMEDVARAAGVARGTVFNHFRRKQSILVAWFAEEAERLAERVPESGDPLVAVERFFDDLAVLTEAHGDLVVPLMFELLDPDVERSRAAFLALPLNDVLRRLLARARRGPGALGLLARSARARARQHLRAHGPAVGRLPPRPLVARRAPARPGARVRRHAAQRLTAPPEPNPQ